jgi:hypothetical protein
MSNYDNLIKTCAAQFVIAITTEDDAITHELLGQSCDSLMSAVARRGGTITDAAGVQYLRRPILQAALNSACDAISRLAASRGLPIDTDDLMRFFGDATRPMLAVTFH